MSDNTGTQALWPQMISALAAIDRELGLPDDGCNSTEQTLNAIRLLKLAHRDDVKAVTALEGERGVLERLLGQRASERAACAAQIDAMWQEYKAAHPSYRTEYQEGYLDALDAAEQRLKGPNVELSGHQRPARKGEK